MSQPPAPLARNVAEQWALDPALTFINHGCFGARPKCVLEAQFHRRRRFEASPIEVLDRQRGELIGTARAALGAFLRARPGNLGFVTNATAGCNAVLRSLAFNAGDELLTTSHVYNAVRQTLRHIASRSGAALREIDVPFPVHAPQQILDAVDQALSPRTRLLIIDHVTSPTAVVFPVQAIVECCAKQGVDVLIDGAHAPGMLDLDIETIGAAYYAGNLHKWVCAPPGAAFLWARPDRQPGIHPPVISHFLDEDFATEFEWQGTRDIAPWLCVPDALQYFEQFGWDNVRRHNHELAVWVQQLWTQRWGVEPTTPLDGSVIGSMTTVPLPDTAARYDDPMQLQTELWDRWQIEAPIIDWNGRWWIRASCQIYNTPQQYEQVAEAIGKLLLP